jgi:hypothetical protein
MPPEAPATTTLQAQQLIPVYIEGQIQQLTSLHCNLDVKLERVGCIEFVKRGLKIVDSKELKYQNNARIACLCK